MEYLTIAQAAERGISRLRDPKWANPNAYLKIDIVEQDGRKFHGPWVHLYDRLTQELSGLPTPHTVSMLMLSGEPGVAYDGPLDEVDRTLSGR